MKMNNILTKNPYFNVSGLTSSQANYICERIKEHLKPIQEQIYHLETHTSSLDGEALDHFQKVEHIEQKLAEIGALYAISAFLRTAIKEKESRLDEISLQIRNVRAKLEQRLEPIDIQSLDKLANVTFDDFLLTLALTDVVAYKSAEAKAAHIGKFIHNFDAIRQAIHKKERISFKQVGEQVFKIHHTPLYDLDELQKIQAYLLAEHREYETQVNQFKAQFHEFENQAKLKYEQEYSRLVSEREQLLNQQVTAEAEKLLNIKTEIANFKIVVPNEFKAYIEQLLNTTTEF